MSQAFNIDGITPSETATLQFTVSGLSSGETVTDSTIEIRKRTGEIVIPNKTVTTVDSSNGKITGSQVEFRLSASETAALLPSEPTYLFSVVYTTSAGRKQFVVPVGRINPTQTLQSLPQIKLGAVVSGISFHVSVDATKL